jgi:hypothetical protein
VSQARLSPTYSDEQFLVYSTHVKQYSSEKISPEKYEGLGMSYSK